jgi:hypothetical protein
MQARQKIVSGKEQIRKTSLLLPPVPDFNVSLFNLLKKKREQHGLRHSDYAQYRKHCTHVLRNLRARRRPVDPKKTFLTVLFLAERAWAYAMEFKVDDISRNNLTRKAHHGKKRFRKAVIFARLLEESKHLDEKTRTQTRLYSLLKKPPISLQRLTKMSRKRNGNSPSKF